jgi:parallel beta-helix repeat protein
MGDVDTLTTDATTLVGGVNEVHAQISTEVDAEAFIRATNDTTLQANIDTEEAARIQGDLDQVAARIAGDNALQADIDALVVGAGTSSAEVVAAREALPFSGGNAPATLDEQLQRIGVVYNLLSYGGDNSGATDTTAALVAACDAAHAAGGGTVWIPQGIYLFETTCTLDNLDHVIITGEPGAVLQFEIPSPNPATWLYILAGHNVTLRNLHLVFVDDTHEISTHAIILRDCTNCRVENTIIIGHRDATLTDSEGNIMRIENGIAIQDSTYCTATGCHVEWARAAYRFQVADGGECKGNSVINCSSADCMRFIMLDGANAAGTTGTVHDDDYAIGLLHHNKVIGCHALRCIQLFTKIHTGDYYNVIANNTIQYGGTENAVQGMIDVNSAYNTIIGNTLYVPGCIHTAIIYVEATGWHSTISGNVITTSATCAAHGIRLTGPSRFVTVTGNTIDLVGGAGDGIVVDDVSLEWTVSGNAITNATTGILIDQAQRGSIVGNNIFDSTEYGMYLTAGKYIAITGNSIIGTGFGGIVGENTSTDLAVSANTILSVNTGSASTDVKRAHIGFTSACNHINIIGNICKTASGSPVPSYSIDANGTDSVNIIANHTQVGVRGGSTNSNTQYNT